ncbi:MAG: PASTA domain-containing protein [Clostridia bacterium]|nr:PASTA domain-containing protein [Clostridia bacterium]
MNKNVSNKIKTNDAMLKRVFVVMVLIFVAFLVCTISLVITQLVKGEHYKQIAESQQLSDTKISAQRGVIYDRNMSVLAQSATSWRVYIVPSKIKSEEAREVVIKELSAIVGVSEEDVRAKTERDSNYETIKSKVDSDVKAKVEELIRSDEYKGYGLINIIGVSQDAKRYYPNSTLASTLIGFTGTDDQGLEGLESFYDKYLTGVAGRVITAVNGVQGEMPNSYETIIDAQQGYSLVLTVDETLQYYLEKHLEDAMEETKSKGAYGIMMDVKTGAILAMSSKPDYDLNDPWSIISEKTLEEISLLNDEKKPSAMSAAINEQWRNSAISDTYQPGSVFKIITAAAALEEGLVGLNDHFNCPGYIVVANRRINCHKLVGHGDETFLQGLMNSCNPVFIDVGSRLGVETFMNYFDAFGLNDRTGIDLPGEATSITHEKLGVKMGISELASCSFGQTFQVTPIQMITAVASVANGGKLMQPYIVQSVIDENGNTVSTTEPTVKSQVISGETASTLCSMLEKVVSEGGGKNAYVPGYRIAGKTGTSEKIGESGEGEAMKYIASFVGFAPADDPEVILLVVLDEPSGYSHMGGTIAAPLAAEIFSDALAYLNVDVKYTEDELKNLNVYVPNVVGSSVSSAKTTLKNYGFNVKVVGNGNTVISQTPSAYNTVSKGGTVVVYTDNTEARMVEMPDLTGYTVAQVNRIMSDLELNAVFTGGGLNSSDAVVYSQSVAPGQKIEIGGTVTISFRHISGVDDF